MADIYQSVFRVDGVPILPPVIDDARRIKLEKWRQMAIRVERRLKEKRAVDGYSVSPSIDTGTKEANASDTANDTAENPSSAGSSTVRSSPAKSKPQNRSTSRNLSKEFLNVSNEDVSTLDVNTTTASSGTESTASSSGTSTMALLNSSVYLSCTSNACATPASTETEEPQSPQPPPRLVRSNSYTLEHPSDAFIKHMEVMGIDVCSELSELSSAMSTRQNVTPVAPSNVSGSDTGQSSLPRRKSTNAPALSASVSTRTRTSLDSQTPKKAAKPVKPIQISSSESKTPIISKTKAKVGAIKKADTREDKLRGICSSASEPRIARVKPPSPPSQVCIISSRAPPPLPTAKKPKSPASLPTSAPPMPKKPSKSNLNEYNRLLQLIEERHQQQMNDLLERQQTEQQRLQLEFSQQQAILSQQISQMMANNATRAVTSNGPNSCFDMYKLNNSLCGATANDSSSVCECDDTEPEYV